MSPSQAPPGRPQAHPVWLGLAGEGAGSPGMGL